MNRKLICYKCKGPKENYNIVCKECYDKHGPEGVDLEKRRIWEAGEEDVSVEKLNLDTVLKDCSYAGCTIRNIINYDMNFIVSLLRRYRLDGYHVNQEVLDAMKRPITVGEYVKDGTWQRVRTIGCNGIQLDASEVISSELVTRLEIGDLVAFPYLGFKYRRIKRFASGGQAIIGNDAIAGYAVINPEPAFMRGSKFTSKGKEYTVDKVYRYCVFAGDEKIFNRDIDGMAPEVALGMDDMIHGGTFQGRTLRYMVNHEKLYLKKCIENGMNVTGEVLEAMGLNPNASTFGAGLVSGIEAALARGEPGILSENTLGQKLQKAIDYGHARIDSIITEANARSGCPLCRGYLVMDDLQSCVECVVPEKATTRRPFVLQPQVTQLLR